MHRALTCLAASAAVLLAGPAAAADTFVAPDWLRRPSPDMLRAVWPREALKKGRGGRVVLVCQVSVQGALFGCKVESEDPPDMGFGGAAIIMTPQLLMKPATLNGTPVVSTGRFPINFKTDGPMTSAGSPAAKRLVPATMAWPLAPSHADVVAAYPQKARLAGVGGLASLECEFGADGVPKQCRVMREEPKGYGFGAAAKDLAKKFRAPAELADGTAIRLAMVQLPFAFSPDMLTAAEPVVGKAVWAKTPTLEAIRATFPKAPAGGDTIRVMLGCIVEQGGAVAGCRVEQEAPSGQGYGASVLALAGNFRLSTWTMEGLPAVGGKVRIPIRYQFTEPAAALPAKK